VSWSQQPPLPIQAQRQLEGPIAVAATQGAVVLKRLAEVIPDRATQALETLTRDLEVLARVQDPITQDLEIPALVQDPTTQDLEVLALVQDPTAQDQVLLAPGAAATVFQWDQELQMSEAKKPPFSSRSREDSKQRP
jgi:hypothetical protein